MRILITGGAGFIGSAFVRYVLSETDDDIAILDALTYASNLQSLESVAASERYQFENVDIRDGEAVRRSLARYQPDRVLHLAAETHVDRSIDAPREFIDTNVVGTLSLLEAVRDYWLALEGELRGSFRFHHVSTDEVFGSLKKAAPPFREDSRYQPSSPYAASKAAADHLVRAWASTYALPVVVTHSANNYGPYQFPEKLIPLMTLNALEGKPLPVYGDGQQIRDWLFVEDHVHVLHRVLSEGTSEATYNIGGGCEVTNLEVVTSICEILDELVPAPLPRHQLIEFVEDRPGHDRRYSLDCSLIKRELNWEPRHSFASGLRKTIEWFVENADDIRGNDPTQTARKRRGLARG